MAPRAFKLKRQIGKNQPGKYFSIPKGLFKDLKKMFK